MRCRVPRAGFGNPTRITASAASSARSRTIFGTKPEKLIGKKVEDFTRAAQDPSVQNHFNTIQQHKPYRDVVTSINTSKGVRFIKASGKPLYDESGKFLGYRGIAAT